MAERSSIMTERIQKIIEQAKEACLKHGSHLTPKRQTLLLSLIKSGRALSAYELVKYSKNEYNEVIPAMSAYRILDFFQQIHLVHKLNSVNKFTICSHILEDDDKSQGSLFLICHQCHRVKELHINKSIINALEKEIGEQEFHIITRQLELKCQCEACLVKSKP